jgi:hypothetical protein
VIYRYFSDFPIVFDRLIREAAALGENSKLRGNRLGLAVF